MSEAEKVLIEVCRKMGVARINYLTQEAALLAEAKAAGEQLAKEQEESKQFDPKALAVRVAALENQVNAERNR